MIVYPGLLVPAALEAGIKVPDPLEEEILDYRETHPHFFVFCVCQLGRSMGDMGQHWTNAKVIAEFSVEEIKAITPKQLEEAGFNFY